MTTTNVAWDYQQFLADQYATGCRLLGPDWGWRVIPVDINKKPTVRAWGDFKVQRMTSRRLKREIFEAPRLVFGLAAILGPSSNGLAVRDFDSFAAYDAWRQQHPESAAKLPTVRSGRVGGGYHVYHRCRWGAYHKFRDGSSEYLGDMGHIIVLPGSRHRTGTHYTWLRWKPNCHADIQEIDPIAHGLLPAHRRPAHLGKHQPPQQPTEAIRVDLRSLRSPAGQGSGEAADSLRSSRSTKPTALILHQAIPVIGSDGGPGDVRDQMGWRAVVETLPTGPGMRVEKLWELCGRLKANFPTAEAHELERVVRGWWDRAYPYIATKAWSATWGDFETAWANRKFAAGLGVDEVYRTAREEEGTTKDRLRRICERLAILTGGHFFLPQLRVAAALGVNQPTLSRHILDLVTQGFIRVVRPGKAGKNGKPTGQAGEYALV